ncbi:predicted protein [Coccidioides posadasii str. Silveira]|uniref:Predicted protein n=1 Tax=Coccidioides posadasii (strain RMSCC 757 / Silveira) TaxID=443226 RepID=E9D660_COCPS|nr:predicted protein [Coccidioides posadasii str. Silveira]
MPATVPPGMDWPKQSDHCSMPAQFLIHLKSRALGLPIALMTSYWCYIRPGLS